MLFLMIWITGGSGGPAPQLLKKNWKNDNSTKKNLDMLFPAFLEILVTYFKPARDLCVLADVTINFKGGLGGMPPSF